MEELLKKQLRFQKIITGCLVIIIVMLLAAGVGMAQRMNEMTVAMEEAVEKIQNIDIEGINDAIKSTNEMLESVDELSAAVDSVTENVKEFDNWFRGIFGK